MDDKLEVGCETTDGLLITHPASKTCEVCSDPNVQGEVPKQDFVDPRQEHEEFEAGAASELQNAYAHSKATIPVQDDTKEIKKRRRQGKYVVVSEVEVCCPSTDAVIGVSKRLIQSFDTREQAVASLNGSPECEDLYIVEPPKSRKKSDEPQPFWNATRIKEICSNSDGSTTLENGKVAPNSFIIYRFLQAMYTFQTSDEQASGYTKNQNNVGFNGTDAAFLSDVAVKSKQYGRLTPNQARAVGRCLKKYAATQLAPLAQDAAASIPENAPKAGYRSETEEQARQQAAQDRPAEQQQLPIPQGLDAMVAAKKADDPEGYYDPFGEGERLADDAAVRFWTKRFATHPYVRGSK